MGIALYRHNREAYERAAALLRETGRAAVVHPTGTGKSYIAFKLCEDHPEARVLWLSPSEHIFQTQLASAKRNGFCGENIVFVTYARLTANTDEEIRAYRPNYIVLDEFHRAGAQAWGRRVRFLLQTYQNVPLLGLSATNVRYLDGCRDMAEELFGGCVASRMTLGEAIACGILPAPVYVTALYSCNKQLQTYERRVQSARSKRVRDEGEQYLQALRRALEKADGLDVIFGKYLRSDGKYLVFCPDRAQMDLLMARADEMFPFARERALYRVYSDDPQSEQAYHAFVGDDSARLRLLYCIDMLNEGIHVADVDGVILFRPTVSPIVYKQQIGRALSADMGRGAPVILDIVDNFENLYSVGAIEEEMEEAAGYYRMTGENERIVNERFRIVDEVRECRALFHALEETLSAPWEAMYREAAEYYRAHGDLNVPQRYQTAGGYALGRWIAAQRRMRSGGAAGELSAERIQRLDAIGMEWQDYRARAFERVHGAAERYYRAHGDLDVPARYVDGEGYPLGAWIAAMRRCRAGYTGILTKERAERLDRLGMIWDKNDYLFERNYAAAEAYYRAHGDLNVPVRYRTENGVNLGAWLHDIKRRRQELDADKAARLDRIGMVWESAYERNFRRGCEELRAYIAEHGAAQVPSGYTSPSGFKLGAWLAARRVNGGRKLTRERRQALADMGVTFAAESAWEEKYRMAAAYRAAHGDLEIPKGYTEGGVRLGEWLAVQRRKHRLGTLSAERTARLEHLGVCWTPSRPRASLPV